MTPTGRDDQPWRALSPQVDRLQDAAVADAEGTVADARQGDPAAIQAADTIDDCIVQLRQILEAGLDLTDDLLDRATAADTAHHHVTQALAEAQPGRLTGPHRRTGRSDNDGSPQ